MQTNNWNLIIHSEINNNICDLTPLVVQLQRSCMSIAKQRKFIDTILSNVFIQFMACFNNFNDEIPLKCVIQVRGNKENIQSIEWTIPHVNLFSAIKFTRHLTVAPVRELYENVLEFINKIHIQAISKLSAIELQVLEKYQDDILWDISQLNIHLMQYDLLIGKDAPGNIQSYIKLFSRSYTLYKDYETKFDIIDNQAQRVFLSQLPAYKNFSQELLNVLNHWGETPPALSAYKYSKLELPGCSNALDYMRLFRKHLFISSNYHCYLLTSTDIYYHNALHRRYDRINLNTIQFKKICAVLTNRMHNDYNDYIHATQEQKIIDISNYAKGCNMRSMLNAESYSHDFMQRAGFRCNYQLRKSAQVLVIEFEGTKDFFSLATDFEYHGPGSHTAKKYAFEFIAQLAKLLSRLQQENSEHTNSITLVLSGHSLGGALAKYMLYEIMQVIALIKHNPAEIIAIIKQNIQHNQQLSKLATHELLNDLNKHYLKFRQLLQMEYINSIIVHTRGAPGVSFALNHNTTLLSYYTDSYISVYQEFHAQDTITKYGECELFDGRFGTPNVRQNKAIQFDTLEEKSLESRLAKTVFPGCSVAALHLHGKRLFDLKINKIQLIIINLVDSQLVNKMHFPTWQRILYATYYRLMKEITKLRFVEKTLSFALGGLHNEATAAVNLRTTPDQDQNYKRNLAARLIARQYRLFRATTPANNHIILSDAQNMRRSM